MRRLGRTVPAVLLAFVGSTVLPRAAFVLHTHAGGEHVHVHAEEDLASGHRHEPVHPHAHAHPHPGSHDGADGPALAASYASPAAHVHWQHPFQRADRPAPAAPVRAEVVAPLAALHPADRLTPAVGPIRSRGPPAFARS